MSDLNVHPGACYRFRILFDLDVSYKISQLDAKQTDLQAIRDQLLSQDDLLDQLLTNKALNILADYLSQMQKYGGIQGFEPFDLFITAATQLSGDIDPIWLDSKTDAISFSEAILDAPLSGEVVRWSAEKRLAV